MNRRRMLIIGSGLAIAVAAGGAGLAIAGDGGEAKDKDAPLSGTDLDRAAQAALEHTGGGTVVESEVGDDGAAYGIEIKLADGSVVEVQLDAGFKVIGQEADDDGAGGESGQTDD
jgi:uncharacterized membrane protein YkoI